MHNEGQANHDVEGQNAQSHNRGAKRLFLINYIIIAILNTVQFSLTVYGRHKLSTDGLIDMSFSNWDALKFCLAVACLTWVFLLYGIFRRTHDSWFDFVHSAKGWDIVIANFIIWALQLSAAAAQTAFVNDYYHCEMDCYPLNPGSIHRNTAYAVFAWLLWTAWTPQLVWSLWDSRSNY